jgi:hypothetical protein
MKNKIILQQHEIWSDIQMEKIPEFNVLEKNINYIKTLSRPENIHLLDKINSNETEDFISKLENTLEINKKPEKEKEKLNIKINKEKQIQIQSLTQTQREKEVQKNKIKSNDYSCRKKNTNSKSIKKSYKNSSSKINFNFNSTKIKEQIILEKEYNLANFIEKNKEKIFDKNFKKIKNEEIVDLMKPKKGNFSHSLKYYNNNEFLTYITNKHEKNENEFNKILNEGRLNIENKINERKMDIILDKKNYNYNINNINNVNNVNNLKSQSPRMRNLFSLNKLIKGKFINVH